MEFLLIASAHFMALLSPGPDFFLILQTALRMQLRYAYAVCCGITAANAVYLSIAIIGLEAVREMETLIRILKYLGGAWLFYLGLLLLRAPGRSFEHGHSKSILEVKSMRRQFSLGFMSAILNPKNVIFYLSLFTVMVSPETRLAVRVLYGVWMAGIVLVWDLGVAGLLGNQKIKACLNRWIFGIEKLSGAMLALFGILLTIQ